MDRPSSRHSSPDSSSLLGLLFRLAEASRTPWSVEALTEGLEGALHGDPLSDHGWRLLGAVNDPTVHATLSALPERSPMSVGGPDRLATGLAAAIFARASLGSSHALREFFRPIQALLRHLRPERTPQVRAVLLKYAQACLTAPRDADTGSMLVVLLTQIADWADEGWLSTDAAAVLATLAGCRALDLDSTGRDAVLDALRVCGFESSAGS